MKRTLRNWLFSAFGLELGRDRAMYTFRQQLRFLIRHHDISCVFDVGANRGQFGALCRFCGFRGPIHSFEPVKGAYQSLEERSRSDMLWYANNIGLAEANRQAHINVFASDDFSSLLLHSAFGSERFPGLAQSTKEKIELRATADELEKRLCRRSKNLLLKCDTQGYDLQVLRGAGNRLGDFRVIVLELSFMSIYDEMPHWTETALYLESYGFFPVSFAPVTRQTDSKALIEANCFFVQEIK